MSIGRTSRRQVTYFDASKTVVDVLETDFFDGGFRDQILEDLKKCMSRLDVDISNEAAEVSDIEDGNIELSNTFSLGIVPDNVHGEAEAYNTRREYFMRRGEMVLEDHSFFKCLLETIYNTLPDRESKLREELYRTEEMERGVGSEVSLSFPGMETGLIGLSDGAGIWITDDFFTLLGGGDLVMNERLSMLDRIIAAIVTNLPYLNREETEFNKKFIASCVVRNIIFHYYASLHFNDAKVAELIEEAGVLGLPPVGYNVFTASEHIQVEEERLFSNSEDLYPYFLNLLDMVQSWGKLIYPTVIDIVRRKERQTEAYNKNYPYSTLIQLTDFDNYSIAVFEIDNDEELGLFEGYAGRRTLAGLYNSGSGSSVLMTGVDDAPFIAIADRLTQLGATDIIGSYIGDSVFQNPCLYVLYINRSEGRMLTYLE